MIELMDMLCQSCPKLKYLSVDVEGSIGVAPIENISLRPPNPNQHHKGQFENLENIRTYFFGMSDLQTTEYKIKYFKDYIIAKCPKITKIKTELDCNRDFAEDDLDLLFDVDISIWVYSIPYTNFYLRESRLVEQKVTQS